MRKSKKLTHEGLTINLAEVPEDADFIIIDRDTPNEEWITIKGFVPPVIDKKGKIIKPGKLLGVNRSFRN